MIDKKPFLMLEDLLEENEFIEKTCNYDGESYVLVKDQEGTTVDLSKRYTDWDYKEFKLMILNRYIKRTLGIDTKTEKWYNLIAYIEKEHLTMHRIYVSSNSCVSLGVFWYLTQTITKHTYFYLFTALYRHERGITGKLV